MTFELTRKHLKTQQVKLQFLRWLQNAVFLQNMSSFLILFTQFDYINKRKLMDHIFSITGRFWMQLILLNKPNFCDRINFQICLG